MPHSEGNDHQAKAPLCPPRCQHEPPGADRLAQRKVDLEQTAERRPVVLATAQQPGAVDPMTLELQTSLLGDLPGLGRGSPKIVMPVGVHEDDRDVGPS